jgi:hypothetical protein
MRADQSIEWDESSAVAESTITYGEQDDQAAPAEHLGPLIDFSDEIPSKPAHTPASAATRGNSEPNASNKARVLEGTGEQSCINPLPA